MKNLDLRINIKGLILLALLLFGANPQLGALLLSETTWGGSGSDVSEGVATAADGTSYGVGISDRFTADHLPVVLSVVRDAAGCRSHDNAVMNKSRSSPRFEIPSLWNLKH